MEFALGRGAHGCPAVCLEAAGPIWQLEIHSGLVVDRPNVSTRGQSGRRRCHIRVALRLTNAVVSLSRRLGTLAVSRAGALAFGPHLAPDWGKGNEPRALTASYLGALRVGEDQEGEVEMQNRMWTLGVLFCFCIWKTGISIEPRWLDGYNRGNPSELIMSTASY